MNYKDDWYCTHCLKPFKQHLKTGENVFEKVSNNNFDRLIPIINIKDWCFEDKDSYGTERNTWHFNPVDNLTQVELLAKQKNLND